MEKILILGSTGLVGKAIIEKLNIDYTIYGLSRNIPTSNNYRHIEYDIEKDDINSILETINPEIIISCVRGDFDSQLNVHSQVAKFAKINSSKLYFFSTANVFDGDPSEVKYENSELCPRSEYGKFKASCEILIQKELNNNAVIMRLPMVFGENSKRVNELNNIEELVVYENVFFTTIFDTDIAILFVEVLKSELSGIFHFTSDDVINHLEFYNKIIGEVKYGKIEGYDNYYLAIKSSRQDLIHKVSNADVIGKIRTSLNRV